MKGKFYNYYLSRINKRYITPRTFLESGLICEIKYKAEYSGRTKNYIVLMLNQGHRPFPIGKKTHVLVLDHISPITFNQFVDDVGLELSKFFKNVRRLKIEKLLMERLKSKQFYISKIKPNLETKFNNSYRTFSIENIQRISVLDFKFKGVEIKLEETKEKQVKKQPTKEKEIRKGYDDTKLKE